MDQDLSLVFSAARISSDDLRQAVIAAFEDSLPENLVILYSDDSLYAGSIRKAFNSFTVTSLWGDGETGVTRFALEISKMIPAKVVVLTAADHSCVGGYQIIEAGWLLEADWSGTGDTDEYTTYGLRGLKNAYGLEVFDNSGRVSCLKKTPGTPNGICVLTSTRSMHVGPLTSDQILRVIEDDIPGASFECLLAE